jgi:hypothetical protein
MARTSIVTSLKELPVANLFTFGKLKKKKLIINCQ